MPSAMLQDSNYCVIILCSDVQDSITTSMIPKYKRLFQSLHLRSLQLMVRGVEEKLVLKGVLPQLTKLARDSEM